MGASALRCHLGLVMVERALVGREEVEFTLLAIERTSFPILVHVIYEVCECSVFF